MHQTQAGQTASRLDFAFAMPELGMHTWHCNVLLDAKGVVVEKAMGLEDS